MDARPAQEFVGRRRPLPSCPSADRSAHRVREIQIGSSEGVVRAADAKPAPGVSIQFDVVRTVVVRLAVPIVEYLDQQAVARASDLGFDLLFRAAEIVKRHQRGIAPVVAHRQHFGTFVRSTTKLPQLISGHSLRARIIRSVQFRSDCGSRRWAATLTFL